MRLPTMHVDAMILRDRDANANPADGLEQRHYVQHDANFNVTAITDPTGTVAERYLYDPYGQATRYFQKLWMTATPQAACFLIPSTN